MKRAFIRILVQAALVIVLVAGLALGCCGDKEVTSDEVPPVSMRSIKLATTTSTDNSGLLDELLPAFAKKHGTQVKVISVGTGKALKHGEAGDVDVILVHAREAEDRFVAEGFGVNRRDVMHNDFVILGPASDPAGIRGAKDVAAALKKIAEAKAAFISRGDESGTHKKELRLWREAGVSPEGTWYMPVGQGMGAVLTLADEKLAYTMADRGTYLAYRGKLDLIVLVEGDPRLFNPYGVIAVNPARHPHVRYEEAMEFIGWLTSVEGQGIIGDFRKDGELLFHPDAVPLITEH